MSDPRIEIVGGYDVAPELSEVVSMREPEGGVAFLWIVSRRAA